MKIARIIAAIALFAILGIEIAAGQGYPRLSSILILSALISTGALLWIGLSLQRISASLDMGQSGAGIEQMAFLAGQSFANGQRAAT